MDPDTLFAAANATALAGWIVLALSPLSPRWSDRISGIVLPLVLSVLYTALALVHFAGAEGGFGTLDDVARLFTSREIVLLGWVHYLAFDLFVGAWILREALRLDVEPRAYLLLTLMVGPLGLGAFLLRRLARLRSLGELGAPDLA